jgi:hypothetical protein
MSLSFGYKNCLRPAENYSDEEIMIEACGGDHCLIPSSLRPSVAVCPKECNHPMSTQPHCEWNIVAGAGYIVRTIVKSRLLCYT